MITIVWEGPAASIYMVTYGGSRFVKNVGSLLHGLHLPGEPEILQWKLLSFLSYGLVCFAVFHLSRCLMCVCFHPHAGSWHHARECRESTRT